MLHKYLISILFAFVTTPCISQIYGTGNGGWSMNNCILWRTPGTLSTRLLTLEASCYNNKTTVKWATASSSNNDSFAIERSTDGIRFQTIGHVRSNGSYNTTQYFSFTDNAPQTGLNYYRLRQRMLNGDPEYSHMVSSSCKINNTSTNISFNLFPNPTSGALNVIATEPVTSIIIRDLTGKSVQCNKPNSTRVTINIEHLAQAIYIVEVNTATTVKYQKIVLKKY